MRRYLEPAEIRVDGPLASYSSGFCVRLSTLGYSPVGGEPVAADGTPESLVGQPCSGRKRSNLPVVTAYLEERRANGYTCWLSSRGLAPLLGYLADLGASLPTWWSSRFAVVTAAQRLVEAPASTS